MEEARGGERAAGEDRAAFGAVGQDQPLVGAEEVHVMVAGDGAAAQGGEADRAVARA